MRKFIQIHAPVRVLNVGFDVGKDKLNWETNANDEWFSGELLNTTDTILEVFRKLASLAKRFQYDEVRIICESTGVYHRSLLQLAGQFGFRTSLVSGEAVAKMRSIESNDPNKNDDKDPGTILAVAKIGKLLAHRLLDEQYAELREHHAVYVAAEEEHARCKTQLHHALKAIFPDLNLTKHSLFGPGGLRMMHLFHGNPVWIVSQGSFEKFAAKMREDKTRVHSVTLRKIWEAAEASCKQHVPPIVRMAQSTRISHLAADLGNWARRLEDIEQKMVACYLKIKEQDTRIPERTLGVITEFMASRILAETGPLSDFHSHRQLVKYAGLNLYVRKSGKWQGKTKISRRGRANLRHVLNMWALSLVSPRRIYSEYYRRKRDSDKMPGDKAMVCVMRKALKMLWGWSRQAQQFDRERISRSAATPKRIAASEVTKKVDKPKITAAS
jgi:transposase